MRILAFSFFKDLKKNLQYCGDCVAEFAWSFFRRIRPAKLFPIILEQYLRLYNVGCEPTYAFIEGSEVCQLNQTFEFSVNRLGTQEQKCQLDCKERYFKRRKKIV